MQQTYFFFFGGFPQLSAAELSALADSFSLKPLPLTPNIRQLQLLPNQLPFFQSRLGGTTKIAELVSNHLSPSDLSSQLISLLNQIDTKNIALTNYTPWLKLPPDFVSQLKHQLASPKRFLNFNLQPPSLIALRKQHATEIAILPQSDHSLFLAKTIWIQDSDHWVERDRHRPYQDIKRGMLPPKIARIMVNLATTHQPKGLLIDPFCGTGTIPLEAMLLGYDVFASDLDSQAVVGTRQNLTWLQQRFHLQSRFQVQQLDATHLGQVLSRIDFIVTEPFMGKLLDDQNYPHPQKLKNIIKGLNKLYLGVLKNWHPLLHSQSRVVMIFPQFQLFDRVWSIPLIDTCEKLGYNKLAQLSYSKPQAKVARQILILQKSDHRSLNSYGSYKTNW